MKCYSCGCTLSEYDFCTGCGADVKVYKKILYLSNMYYNDGLKKAQVRDLSGAVISLRQSLKCNKNNIDARNLLGLVYFEMGEAVSALSEWVISKNLKSKKNIADDFIKQVQGNPSKLDAINQAIKKYNQALTYCRQDSLDLAVIQLKKVLSINPNMIKGYQLLALLYMNGEEWDKAKKTILKAVKIDANNTISLTYLREIDKMLAAKEEAGIDSNGGKRKKKAPKEEAITYQSGNETIIQPLNGPERSGGTTILNILVGMVIGVGIMWFLILPSRIQSEKSDINKNLVEVSNQLTEKSAAIEELNKRVEALQKENTELETQIEDYTGSDGVMNAADDLMAATYKYIKEPGNAVEVMDLLEKIETSYVEGSESSEEFKTLYKLLFDEVGTKAAAEYLSTGLEAFRSGDYTTAITDLTKAYEMDETNVEALYNLAHSYRHAENTDKADELYQEVIDKFPSSVYARNAKGYKSDSANRTANANSNAGNSNGNPAGANESNGNAGTQQGESQLPAVNEPTLPPTPDPNAITDPANPLGTGPDVQTPVVQ
ncbi:hypothetical protein D7X88_11830 [bacterium C-53]|nr:hypothetical protein [Lachnospiraceae bacterium]NBI03718.1 hypothetical protein [Lachnospiraceae bacterium]RKJ09273.1 hypothetical protein D7X88_11830 [bacterium C-53]